MKTRETYHHGDLRATLVAEALRQLETGGQESVSLRALAKEAGVSPNAPYRHFADKNALMGALAAEGFQRFAEAIERASPPDKDPVSTLKDQGEAYLAFASARPALYRLMFSPFGYSLHSEPCQLASQRSFGCLVAATARAQATGWKKDCDLTAVVLSYWSALHGWAALVGDSLVPPGVPLPDTKTWLSVFFSTEQR